MPANVLQIHLFDVVVLGQKTFTESEVFCAGSKLFTFDTGKTFGTHRSMCYKCLSLTQNGVKW